MNREQAKLIGAADDELLETLGYPEYIDQREFVVAFGRGENIEVKKSNGEWKRAISITDTMTFFGGNEYRIATPKITFNGVEIDAPIREKPFDSTPVWTQITVNGLLEPRRLMGRAVEGYHVKAGCVFATREACQLYCDTHNKMMGIGE